MRSAELRRQWRRKTIRLSGWSYSNAGNTPEQGLTQGAYVYSP